MARTRIQPSGRARSGKQPLGGRGNRTRQGTADKQADVLRKQRRDQVVKRTVEGVSGTAIAAELGVDEKTIRNDLAHYLAENPPPGIEQIRETQRQRLERAHQRLDIMLALLQRRLSDPETGAPLRADQLDLTALGGIAHSVAQATQAQVKVAARVARLFGADAPEQKELSGPGGGPIPIAAARTTLADVMLIVEQNRRPVE